MKENVIYINGLVGLLSIGCSVFLMIDAFDSYSQREHKILVAIVFLAFGIVATYTSKIALSLLEKSLGTEDEKSLLALKAEKTRLTLIKEIAELKKQKPEI